MSEVVGPGIAADRDAEKKGPGARIWAVTHRGLGTTMAPTIERRVRKLYWEGKQYVDDYLAGVDHGELKNLGALCANWSAVSVAVTTLICLFALGQAAKGVLTTWYLFVSAVALSSCMFTMTIFGYCREYCKRTLEQLDARARGSANAADPKKLKVCGQCDAPFANQRTNPAGNRWICASCGMISRKPKLATREELDRPKAAGERASSSSAKQSPQEAEERRQAVKQTKDLRRRHAREVKEAREAADREEREEIARLIEEERHRVMTARAEEELERRRVEEEERAKREEEEAAARCAAEEEAAAAKAKAAEGSAERAAAKSMTRRHTSLTRIPAPRPVNVPPRIPPPPKQQRRHASAPLVAAAKVGAAPVPARPPATPRSSAPATPSTPDFDPPLPPMRPMQPAAAAAAWGGAVAAGGSPHAAVSPHASTSPTASSFVAGRSPSERSPPPPPGGRSPPGFDPLLGVPESRRSWPGGALGGLGMGAAGIRGILDGEEEVAAVPVAPPPPPGAPPGYAVGGAPPPLPAGPPPSTAQKVGVAAPGQPPLPPMPHPSQIKAAAAAEKGGNPRAFLASLELAAYAPVFERERITLADISLLTEPDLERLGLPLGPRRRILAAIAGVNIGTPAGDGTRGYHHTEQRRPVVSPGTSAVVSPNPFRVARTSSVDGDGATVPGGTAGTAGTAVPGGASGWNGGGFGGGLFGGFASSAPGAEPGHPGPTHPVATAPTYNHSRQRSRSTDSDALAMDSLENDLMALTGGLNLDDDDDLGRPPPPIVEVNTGDADAVGTTDAAATEDDGAGDSPPGTPPKPPSRSALDSLDADGVPTDAANKHAHAQQQREATDPPKPPSEMMVKAAARLRAAAAAGHPIPNEFVDCITCEVMVDPVIAWDGHTYERDPIARWLQRHSTSPMTGETLPDFTLRPNHSMRSQIINYGEKLAREAGH